MCMCTVHVSRADAAAKTTAGDQVRHCCDPNKVTCYPMRREDIK